MNGWNFTAEDGVKIKMSRREKARRGIRLMDGRHCGRCFSFLRIRSFSMGTKRHGIEWDARGSNGYIHVGFFQHGSKRESKCRAEVMHGFNALRCAMAFGAEE